MVAAGQTAANAAAVHRTASTRRRPPARSWCAPVAVVDRIVKSAEVERAGGIGMVLANLTTNTLDGDLHSVPTVARRPAGLHRDHGLRRPPPEPRPP